MRKIACIIPARLKSTRFPKKMVAPLGGKPLLQWTWEAARRTQLFDALYFAIDAQEVADAIDTFGGKYFMTDESCLSGTDRLIELQQRGLLDADVWVNWQGDEPFVSKEMIRALLQSVEDDTADIWTLKKRITTSEEITSPHVVKVVCDVHGHALYFSRASIPYYREQQKEQDYFKHIGLYAFTREALKKIAQLPPAPLEQAEQLEQLRFLSHGLCIRVHETPHETFGIDLPEHLTNAEKRIKKESGAVTGTGTFTT